MEEDFGAEETLVAHVDVEGGVSEGVNSSVQLDPLSWIRVVLRELLHYVRTDVTVALLHTNTSLHTCTGILTNRGIGRAVCTLTALAVSIDCSGGIPTSLSLSSCWIKKVMSRPAMGMCLIQLPIT